jgi:hypothetical protein
MKPTPHKKRKTNKGPLTMEMWEVDSEPIPCIHMLRPSGYRRHHPNPFCLLFNSTNTRVADTCKATMFIFNHTTHRDKRLIDYRYLPADWPPRLSTLVAGYKYKRKKSHATWCLKKKVNMGTTWDWVSSRFIAHLASRLSLLSWF